MFDVVNQWRIPHKFLELQVTVMYLDTVKILTLKCQLPITFVPICSCL